MRDPLSSSSSSVGFSKSRCRLTSVSLNIRPSYNSRCSHLRITISLLIILIFQFARRRTWKRRYIRVHCGRIHDHLEAHPAYTIYQRHVCLVYPPCKYPAVSRNWFGIRIWDSPAAAVEEDAYPKYSYVYVCCPRPVLSPLIESAGAARWREEGNCCLICNRVRQRERARRERRIIPFPSMAAG
jgi:hypothetical protein